MERIARLILIAGVACLGWVSTVHAGTVLFSPIAPENDEATPDPYPDSKFGQAPAPAPATDSGEAAAGRSPAGLQFQGQGAGAPVAGAPLRRDGRTQFSPDFKPENDPGMKTEMNMSSSFRPAMPDETPSPATEATAIRRKGVQEVSIIAGDLGYFPKTFFVTRDIPVRLFVTGASKNSLCIMMDSFQVRKQVRVQKIEEITFTPATPGKYRFYCPVNGMEGTMIVKELASNLGE